jgi:hypothetical protein
MQDIIYIWKSEGQNIGHGSMTLHDGTHISWWPKEEKMFESMRMNQVGCILNIAYFLVG